MIQFVVYVYSEVVSNKRSGVFRYDIIFISVLQHNIKITMRNMYINISDSLFSP